MYKEILVIDDNPDIRLLVSNILKEQNYEVRTAANYDQAVFEINKKLPDLAIIDIKLDKQGPSNAWLTIGLREGKNREVRLLMESIELKVMRLIRISFGPFQLGNLEAGQIEEVKSTSLKEQLGIFSNKVDNFGGEQQRKNSTKKIRNKRKNADHSRNKSGN